MLLFTVIYSKSSEKIINGLEEFVQICRDKGIEASISEGLINESHIIKIFCDKDQELKDIIKTLHVYLANIIFYLLINEMKNKQLQSYINKNYFFLLDEEVEEIKVKLEEYIHCDFREEEELYIYYMNTKNSMISKINSYLKCNEEINITGYMTFRLKFFIDEFFDIVDKIIERYIVQKEYSEFIKLLKYFVEIQESKILVLNLIINPDGSYLVKNKSGDNILTELFSELSDTNKSDNITIEDLLISGLIANSPKKIIIHCVENCRNKEFINTINSVFTSRVVLCNGCKLCKKVKKQSLME